MKKVIILIIFILVITVVAVILWWPSESVVVTQYEKTQEDDDVYQNWGTHDTTLSSLNAYKNLNNHFSVKYPDGWEIDETKGGVTIFLKEMNESQKMWIKPSIQCNKVPQFDDQGIWCYQGDGVVNIKDWCSKDNQGKIYPQILSANYIIDNAYLIDYKSNFGSFRKKCMTRNNKDFVVISYPINNKYSDIYNKILPTFKFRD